MSVTTITDSEYIMADTIKNIKTYKLVEIPLNGEPISTNLSCPLQPHQVFNIGAHYKIVTKVFEKLFECKAYVDVAEETPDTCLDVVIMKQIAGPYNNGWPLTKSDCEFLNIKYEKDLLVFPATYDFKLVK